MAFAVVRATDDDLDFTHELTRSNMAAFYASHRLAWDARLFESSWPETENFCLLEHDERIGILRVMQDREVLWVRDLQVLPARRGRGAGTFAMRVAQELAVQRGLRRLRLRVFEDNRAQTLYRRLGFRQVSVDGGTLVFEKTVEAHRSRHTTT